ncbi:MAG TPA: SGNH/GDSL hydrolase family protein [Phycisphaerae bacterium]|nr:SGNH/GDSL hydrolase family protein [Phycisphaerae bacterium]
MKSPHRSILRPALVIAGLSMLVVATQHSRAEEPAATPPSTDKWAKHYYERVAQFKSENVAPGGVVLVGSSHIEGLDAKRWLPRWTIVNRGISSDRIGIGERGILHRLDCSVFDCAPSVIVLQNGANDIGELWRNGTPTIDEIEACYRKVVETIRERLPDVPFIIAGVKPTRDKYAGLVPLLKDFNARLPKIASDNGCSFVDVYDELTDDEGMLAKEYSRDGLHLTDAGYAIWAKHIDAAIETASKRGGEPISPDNAKHEPESSLLWYDAKLLDVEGKGFSDTEIFYERLPARALPDVTDMVRTLSKRTAGIAIRFETDSATIGAIWDGGGAMNHMAATGNSGLDLYAKRGGKWEFVAVGKPTTQRTTVTLKGNLSGEMTEYLLYLPLYNGVTELLIGVEQDARLIKPAPRPADRIKPIVFYGTSITQGGCASRSGMCHPAILGRWFDREVINLGFSGSGKMEPIMAELLGEIDASVYVLECLPNMTTEMVTERVVPFVHILRKARPDTPILMVESPLELPNRAGNKELKDAFKTLTAEGQTRLYYLLGQSQLAGEENGTVDGVHPTDLGFHRMAVAYKPVLGAILATQDK